MSPADGRGRRQRDRRGLPPGAGAQVSGRGRRRLGGNAVDRGACGGAGRRCRSPRRRRRQRRRQPGGRGRAARARGRRPAHRAADTPLSGDGSRQREPVVRGPGGRLHAHARQHALVPRAVSRQGAGRRRLAGVATARAVTGGSAAGAGRHRRLRPAA